MARLAENSAGAELHPVAFSSPRKLAAYLDARNAQHWQLHLVTCYSATAYLTELQLLGHSTLRVNPSAEGGEGAVLRIADLLEDLTD